MLCVNFHRALPARLALPSLGYTHFGSGLLYVVLRLVKDQEEILLSDTCLGMLACQRDNHTSYLPCRETPSEQTWDSKVDCMCNDMHLSITLWQ